MKIKKLVYIHVFLFILLVMCWNSAFADPYKALINNNTIHTESTREHAYPVLNPVQFFNKYISPVDGDRCPMYPSCSKYCLEAFQKHGLLMGWIMTCDRLVRCGRDEMKLAPTAMENGNRLSYDPLNNNDFWW